MRKTGAFWLLLIVTGVFPLVAGSRKKAWEWTIEERIAARTDVAAQRSRVAEARALRAASATAGERRAATDAASADRDTDRSDAIYGSRHPELFMPSEIYTIFMNGAFLHEDDVAMGFRADAQQKIEARGLPGDLLTMIEVESAEFIRLQKEEDALREQRSRMSGDPSTIFAQIKEIERQQCPVRAAALNRLRERYGSVVIARFLYDVVAPHIFKELGTAPDAATLRAAEEGCK